MDSNFGSKILPYPIEVLLAEGREGLLEEVLVLLGDGEGVEEGSHRLQSSKDSVLSSEGILPEEDFESSMVLVLAVLEVGVGAGELVEVVEQHVDLRLVVARHIYIN